jgi:phosphodiesterase/alkaline phosphatase D-like protein
MGVTHDPHAECISSEDNGNRRSVMNKMLLTLAITATVGSLLLCHPASAQVLPPAKQAARVKIIKGPELESASDYLTIIRWTTNNPGGSDVHYGIVQYGTEPDNLRQTAKNPIRLNRGHSETIFRVRIEGLKPRTTYYYTVTSQESNGTSDRVKSSVNKFTTPGPGERTTAFSPQAGSKPK